MGVNKTKIDPSRKGFFDYPGEIRNLIYTYLLTHNKQQGGGLQASFEILRTSRSVYNEASGIFLNAGTATIAVGTFTNLAGYAADLKFTTEDHGIENWPQINEKIEKLSRVEHVTLILVGQDGDQMDPFQEHFWRLFGAATVQLGGMVLRTVAKHCPSLKTLNLLVTEDNELGILERCMIQTWPFLFRG